MLKPILQVLTFFLLTFPFAYMLYDVSKEVLSESVQFFTKRLRPVLVGLVKF